MLNNVSFGSNAGVFTKPDFSKPQTFTRPTNAQPDAAQQAPQKKSKVGKYILGTVATLAAVAGLLVAGNKTGVLKNLGNYIPDSVKNVSWLQGAKEPVKKVLAGMDTAGGKIADYAMQGYGAVKGFGEKAVETVKGWFSKGTPAA